MTGTSSLFVGGGCYEVVGIGCLLWKMGGCDEKGS